MLTREVPGCVALQLSNWFIYLRVLVDFGTDYRHNHDAIICITFWVS
jgi:hypothetical protein